MKRGLLVGVWTERFVRHDSSPGSFRLERFLWFFSESATGGEGRRCVRHRIELIRCLEWKRAAHRREELLSLIHISEPTRLGMISYAVFCLKKKQPASAKQPRPRHEAKH